MYDCVKSKAQLISPLCSWMNCMRCTWHKAAGCCDKGVMHVGDSWWRSLGYRLESVEACSPHPSANCTRIPWEFYCEIHLWAHGRCKRKFQIYDILRAHREYSSNNDGFFELGYSRGLFRDQACCKPCWEKPLRREFLVQLNESTALQSSLFYEIGSKIEKFQNKIWSSDTMVRNWEINVPIYTALHLVLQVPPWKIMVHVIM